VRSHVGDDKTILLEELEDVAGECLTDDAWNAFAKMNQVGLMAVARWLELAAKTCDRRARGEEE
jgi:hypothetical protein